MKILKSKIEVIQKYNRNKTNKYNLNLECSECGYITKYNENDVKDYQEVIDLINDFLNRAMLCDECLEPED